MQNYIAQYALWVNMPKNGAYVPSPVSKTFEYRFSAKNDKEARVLANDFIFNGDFRMNSSGFRCYPLLVDIKRITKRSNISLDDLMKEELARKNIDEEESK